MLNGAYIGTIAMEREGKMAVTEYNSIKTKPR